MVSGPSGVGKSTITREVLRRTGATFSISATTRRPREGEVDGREYVFVGDAAFQRMIDGGELLEWAEVFGRRYGTPRRAVDEALASGRTVVLEIDVQGALQVHRRMPAATFVLIAPPDGEELTRRLVARGSEDAASAAKRRAKADEEIRTAEQSGVYKYRVVNDDLETAVRQVVDIIKQEPANP